MKHNAEDIREEEEYLIQQDFEEMEEEDDDDDNTSSSPYSNRYNIKPILMLLTILAIIVFGFFIYQSKNTHIPTSHVYICDDAEVKSDFDEWLKESLSVTWVPSYVIIQDGVVIGVFNGDIPEEEFSEKIGTTIALSLPIIELPNYEISNIDGIRQPISSIFSKGTYILEIQWIDCKDCKHQDDYYTNAIYKKYNANNFYRYYIKSDKQKVLDKYVK